MFVFYHQSYILFRFVDINELASANVAMNEDVVLNREILSITLYGKKANASLLLNSFCCLFLSNSKINPSAKLRGKITQSRQTQTYSFPRTNAKRQTAELEFLPFGG